jgi:peptide/nickel transport system substrate-binding protein
VAALCAAAALSGAYPGSLGSSGGSESGVVRLVFRTDDVATLDPALAYDVAAWSLIDLTCAPLLRSGAAHRATESALVPEVAATLPEISRDGKTYTFRVRPGFRFSDGTRVTARAFAHAIHRTLVPGVPSPWRAYTGDIVGAGDVTAGRAATASGVVARGAKLTIRLKRPVPEFPHRMKALCAVPPELPADPEGRSAFPAAGPYYVAEFRPGDEAVIRRNPFYGGRRPHRVDGFTADLRATSFGEVLDRIEAGEADWGWALSEEYFDPERRLAQRFGVNRSRFFVQPGWVTHGFVLNTARPLFRDNPRLRRAVNFAVDRAAMRRAGGSELQSELTDQYLPTGFPGFRDAQIYPLQRPDLRRARELARGNTRSGKAVLFTVASPPRLAAAQSLKRDLARIGLAVEVVGVPRPAYFGRLGATGAYDIGFSPWAPDYTDPFAILNIKFDGRFIGSWNWGRFDDVDANRALRHAASLDGPARYAAYAALDSRLAREFAPMIAVEALNEATLVSARVGCITQPFDLAAVCLKR